VPVRPANKRKKPTKAEIKAQRAAKTRGEALIKHAVAERERQQNEWEKEENTQWWRDIGSKQ
jgi:hypothetical protein